MNTKTSKLVMASMFTALTCIATMIIRIPTFGTNGYVNIGDTIVLISAWVLGSPYGVLAASMGSGLADLLAGYAVYVPGTMIIKALMALFACKIFSSLSSIKLPKIIAYIFSSIIAEFVMILGYFLYEASVLGYGAPAAASIPSNAVQGITCLVLANVLVVVLSGVKVFKEKRQP